jgi:hypothetical protein
MLARIAASFDCIDQGSVKGALGMRVSLRWVAISDSVLGAYKMRFSLGELFALLTPFFHRRGVLVVAPGMDRYMRFRFSILILLWPTLVAVLASGWLTGCGWYPHYSNEIDERKAVKSGYTQLPEARQIDELIGEADHFISGPKNTASGLEWCTDVYFGGRYELGMRVDVEVDAATSKVTRFIGRPKFYLHEVGSVDILPDGRTSVSYRSQHEFGADDWAKIVKAHGDFSAIGIQLDRDHPIANFESYVAQLPHRRFGP